MSYSYIFNFSNAATPVTLKERKLPEGGAVINPDYSVSPACKKGGIAIKDATTKLTRPPKVRPKKSNFGGRYFYVKIQL